MGRVFLYAEFQVSIPFDQIEWAPINAEMRKFPGLRSKTWLSGINTQSVGGFYEFDTREHAQRYVDGLLLPFAAKVHGSLSVRMFDGETTKSASIGMNSPFYREG